MSTAEIASSASEQIATLRRAAKRRSNVETGAETQSCELGCFAFPHRFDVGPGLLRRPATKRIPLPL